MTDTYLKQLKALVEEINDPTELLTMAMRELHQRDPHCHWIGIYLLRGSELHLGTFSGPDTDHKVIPVGRGVCGTAVALGQNQNVADVSAIDNYLACNLETKSELVVLIHHPTEKSEIIGQIDIDSTKLDAFDESDEQFYSEVAEVLAPATLRLRG